MGIIFCANLALAENVFLEEKIIPSEIKEFSAQGNSLRGIFEVDGRSITIETRRGPLISWIMRMRDFTAPLFEIDVRLLDEDGFPFFVQFGGHGPIDGEWISEAEFFQSEAKIISKQDAITNQQLFANARWAIVSLKSLKFKAEFAPEYDVLVGILPLLETEEKNSTENFNDELRMNSSAVSSSDQHYIEIQKKSAFFIGNTFGEHSATLSKAISKSKTYQIWSACNHGSCPGTSGMSKKCSKTFSKRAGFCSSPPMCSTMYGFFSGQHVCNDDSKIQYERIKNNANPSTSEGTCADSSLRINAPNCD